LKFGQTRTSANGEDQEGADSENDKKKGGNHNGNKTQSVSRLVKWGGPTLRATWGGGTKLGKKRMRQENRGKDTNAPSQGLKKTNCYDIGNDAAGK